MRASFEAQISLFPQMSNRAVKDMIQHYGEKSLGWKLSVPAAAGIWFSSVIN